MKTPPAIEPNQLQKSFEATYDVPVRTMQFIPRGECSWGYQIEALDGRSYFLKLFRTTPLPVWAARLCYRLRVESGIENIACPLPARSGELLSNLDGYPAALFDFIAGGSLFQVSSKTEALYSLGELLARLHQCEPLRSDCQRIETFEVLGSEAYDQVLEAANRTITRPGAAGEALGLLRPVKKRLAALKDELLAFQEKARKTPSPYVICHGDPTPGNVLVRAGGSAHLIDWDDMLLAPRERDLVFWEKEQVFFEGQSSYPVLAGYCGRNATSTLAMDPNVIAFYHRQWTAGEIADYGHRLLFEAHDEQQNQSDLENLKEELLWIGEE